MTFDQAKKELQMGFARHDIEVFPSPNSGIFFRLTRGNSFEINNAEIESYREVRSQAKEYYHAPVETSLLSKSYREQLVQFLHPLRERFLPPKDLQLIFGNPTSHEPYVEISQASDFFIWSNLFNEAFFDLIIERLMFWQRRGGGTNFLEMIRRPPTIKVRNLKEGNKEGAERKSNLLINASIFTYTSLRDNPIALLDEWPRRPSKRPKSFSFTERYKGNDFRLPRLEFNEDLVRFYQLAASTDTISFKFLSYYHILEYYFLDVSDNLLYDRLSMRINDLNFRTTSTNLDRIIQDVNAHKTEMDETIMLKNVLRKFVIEDEIMEFIKKYEEFHDDNLYTKKKMIFGTEVAGIKLTTGHIFGPIAKRMKVIRNALVHSSDRHGRNIRFVPFSTNESQIIRRELPLMKFLSEKVITASGMNVED